MNFWKIISSKLDISIPQERTQAFAVGKSIGTIAAIDLCNKKSERIFIQKKMLFEYDNLMQKYDSIELRKYNENILTDTSLDLQYIFKLGILSGLSHGFRVCGITNLFERKKLYNKEFEKVSKYFHARKNPASTRKNPLGLSDARDEILYLADRNDETQSALRKILKSATQIERLGSGGYGVVYRIKTKDKKEYTLKLIIKPISDYCLKNLEKYSKAGIIPEVYVITSHYTLSEYIPGITFAQFRQDYLRGRVYKNVYEYVVKQREYLLDTFKKLFPNDKNLDIRKTQNMIVAYNFENVYLIDPCW